MGEGPDAQSRGRRMDSKQGKDGLNKAYVKGVTGLGS